MLQVPQETERLARLVADRTGRSAEDVVRIAIEREAITFGVLDKPKHRMTAEEMLAFGERIAAMLVLDPRSPQEIMDDLNAI
ncbi:hypothetical protein CO652_06020 [Rhizobium sp. H4]|uniref:type II toxin-antitoxin system VapB family antitoxin n=1 Tax=Rhizobium TaxID=379 RepID=UPI000BE93710|nr:MULTISPECIES: type II toxin-antitoxin system VapB family antitoxin [Rhizobium]PDV89189.1 hypothetical protein CO652_06020 [Rhizobium sp. H4]WET73915.1 type II toxin-antitoxin system VapB family antitoxin [Rhizobium croatiense]